MKGSPAPVFLGQTDAAGEGCEQECRSDPAAADSPARLLYYQHYGLGNKYKVKHAFPKIADKKKYLLIATGQRTQCI